MVTVDISAYKDRLYKTFRRILNRITQCHIPYFISKPQEEDPGFFVFELFPDLGNETSIYRKFSDLAARNLLYLQSELLALKKQLDELDRKDNFNSYLTLEDSTTVWETLMQLSDNGNTQSQARMDLIMKLRAKLKEYRS